MGMLITRAEAARRLGVTRRTLNRLIEDAGLPIIEVGKRPRIEINALRNWLARAPQPPQPDEVIIDLK